MNDFTEFLTNSLDTRWAKYRAELQHCQFEFSEEAVHDLRVATRRLLATIDLIRDILPRARARPLRVILKSQLDNLDDLRDTQVMLLETAEILPEIPELADFQLYLQKQEARLLRTARKQIGSLRPSAIVERAERLREQVVSHPLTVEDLFSAVDEAFGVVVSRDAQVDLAFSPSIHRVRVAFKKFRYMMEIVNPLLPRFPEKNMKKMQEYQTHMGNIQDTEVFLRTLDVFNGQRESYDPQPARRFYEQRHAELILAYMQQRGKLASFWRTAPDQPFPWEQSK